MSRLSIGGARRQYAVTAIIGASRDIDNDPPVDWTEALARARAISDRNTAQRKVPPRTRSQPSNTDPRESAEASLGGSIGVTVDFDDIDRWAEREDSPPYSEPTRSRGAKGSPHSGPPQSCGTTESCLLPLRAMNVRDHDLQDKG